MRAVISEGIIPEFIAWESSSLLSAIVRSGIDSRALSLKDARQYFSRFSVESFNAATCSDLFSLFWRD